MIAFVWMEWKGKTPMELGLDIDDLDPWYHDAMLMIRAGFHKEQQSQLKSKG